MPRGRKSILAWEIRQPLGPNHATRRSRSGQAFQTSSRGALRTREMTKGLAAVSAGVVGINVFDGLGTSVPSPDASLGDGGAAARRPYLYLLRLAGDGDHPHQAEAIDYHAERRGEEGFVHGHLDLPAIRERGEIFFSGGDIGHVERQVDAVETALSGALSIGG